MERESELLLAKCESKKIAFIPWAPIGRGGLKNRSIASVAGKYGVSRHQCALSWLLHRSPEIVLIPGTSSIHHLEQNVSAANIVLTDEDFRALENFPKENLG